MNTIATLDLRPPGNDVVFTSEMRPEVSRLFKRNDFIFPGMEIINNAAYWNYQRDRIYVKSVPKTAHNRRRSTTTAKNILVPNKTLEYQRPSNCPACGWDVVYRHGERSRIIIDLRFMLHGIKQWITCHIITRYRCPSCGNIFYPSNQQWFNSKYGPELAAYAIYQNIELRLPQNRIALSLKALFSLDLSRNTINRFKAAAARTYEITYRQILERLCKGRVIHVDETAAGVMGKEGYVWVVTSLEEVAYFYTPSRSGETIQAMLREFSGVLVSDFYAAYDAIGCPQQKCLIHLIRDLNEELLKHPYDRELKLLVGDFTDVLRAIIATVDRRGLKKRFLGKHRPIVDRFYKRLRDNVGTSEAVRKTIERLHKNRNTLFTFLDYDNVPWNNNNAEHAIKAFAALRRVFEGTTTDSGLHDYLILLSISETCKYKNVDFLQFMRSASMDVDEFKTRVGSQCLRGAT